MTNSILLLNADYRPLQTIPFKRFVSLLTKGAIDIVETDETRELRSATTAQAFPSVVRLKYFVHVPQRHVSWSRRAVFSRDRYTCVFCGKKLSRDEATLDHLIPQEYCRAHGINASTWSNTATACESCNRRKANKTMRDAGMKFFDPDFEPKTPRVNYLVITGEVPDKWKTYIKL